jgi:hypothetical protein
MLAAAVASSPAAVATGAEPVLGLPIACTLGEDCFVQSHVDLDPGPGVRDYACGAASYDGHKGIDIRLIDTSVVERGVPVVAAAAGTVRGTRDGVPDRLVRDDADRRAISGRECGNGVVLDHGDGWETQYCHLRAGSIVVARGAAVAAGARLGDVGYSGDAAFAHVHLSVRHAGEVVDPFRGVAGGEECGSGRQPLWAEAVRAGLDLPATQLLGAGIADRPIELTELETGRLAAVEPADATSMLVSWGWAINLQAGDELMVSLDGPSGELAAHRVTIERHKAQYSLFTGKRRPSDGWPGGEYVARFACLRDGRPVLERETRFSIP